MPDPQNSLPWLCCLSMGNNLSSKLIFCLKYRMSRIFDAKNLNPSKLIYLWNDNEYFLFIVISEVYVWYTYMCMDVSALHGSQRRTLGGLFNHVEPNLRRYHLSLNPERTTIYLHPSQHWECRCMWPHLTFFMWVLGIQTHPCTWTARAPTLYWTVVFLAL